MKYTNTIAQTLLVAIVSTVALVGCKTAGPNCCPAPRAVDVSPPAVNPTPAVAHQLPALAVSFPIRINAGATAPYTDSSGNVWLPDQGFEGGETYERDSDMSIANTKDAPIYRHERFSMNSFSQKVPNGNYLVKLHFAETFEGVEGPGQRVFSFNVEGRDIKDFDVFAKAGGSQRALIETVSVAVADEKLDITFTANVENPEINGIEIIPQP